MADTVSNIDPNTGAPPPPDAPKPAAAPDATAAPANVSTPTPTEAREKVLASTAMPTGAVPPKEATETTTEAVEAPAEKPTMPSGVITEVDSNWQVAAEGAPEQYEKFTVNTGLDDNGVPKREEFAPDEGTNQVYDRFIKDVRSRGLSQEQAQQELDRVADYVEAARQLDWQKDYNRANEWAKELDQWGFAKNPEVMRNVGSALKRYDPNNRVRDLLESTGAGNMPEVAHMLSELGRKLGEGGSVADTQVMTPNAGPKPIGGSRPTNSYQYNLAKLTDGVSQGLTTE